YLLRRDRPNLRRPFKLPEWMKYVALAIAAFYAIIYFYGGPVYASCSCSLAGHSTLVYYFIGWAVLAAYLPLYWCRERVGDTRHGEAPEAVTALPAPGRDAMGRGAETPAPRVVHAAPSRSVDPRDLAHPARVGGPTDLAGGARFRMRARSVPP